MMKTLTVHPANSDQETAIRIFLDALHVEYKTGGEVDDNTYLMSSPAMVNQLNTAILQEEQGQGKKVTLDDVWK
jgi:hypothetical protein